MSNATTLTAPWLALAEKLGGAVNLYCALEAGLNISTATAKRLCRDRAKMSRAQWVAVTDLFDRLGVDWRLL